MADSVMKGGTNVADAARQAPAPLDIKANNLVVLRGEEEVDTHVFVVDDDFEGFGALVRRFKFFNSDSHVTYNFSISSSVVGIRLAVVEGDNDHVVVISDV